MDEEKKKTKIENVEDEIGALENQYTTRSFSYDPDADKGYQDYVAMMQQNGKKAMQDTVGKASALTGGFANSYAVNAGQGVYNEFVKQAADAQASFRQLAREEYDAETQDILGRLNMVKQQKSDIWSDAALKAGFGDYSGYVDDLGLYDSTEEAQKALSGVSDPTEAQIAYAKQAYEEGGENALNNYVASLDGVNADAIFEAVTSDGELAKKPDVMKRRFTRAYNGGANGFGGLDRNAELILDAGTPNAETKTVKEWYKVLTKSVEDGGYGWSKDDAKDFLIELQDDLDI